VESGAELGERRARVARFDALGLELVDSDVELARGDRFLADGLVHEDQCEALADLARVTCFTLMRQVSCLSITFMP